MVINAEKRDVRKTYSEDPATCGYVCDTLYYNDGYERDVPCVEEGYHSCVVQRECVALVSLG